MENIKKFFSSLKLPILVVNADEDELVDYQVILREDCDKKHCTKLKEVLEECNTRVNSKKKTSETCTEELYDWLHCVDHCVSKTLFSKLK